MYSIFVINIKDLFQELCEAKLPWDEELTGINKTKYETILRQIEQLQCLEMPRFVFDSRKTVSRVELQAFSDASEKAYASVVYLRTIYDTGEVDLKFLAAKAKIAPLKRQSIPRLELLGACLMSQLVDTVRKTLQDELSHPNITTFYWVDSIAVLCWITNNKVWRPYVQNRVNSILSLSSKDDWYHCPGKLNPADLPSRGKPNLSSLWWEGPRFLKLPQSEWPQHKTEQLPPCVLSEERKSEVPAPRTKR